MEEKKNQGKNQKQLSFREQNSLAERKVKSQELKKQYPDRIPIILEKHRDSKLQVQETFIKVLALQNSKIYGLLFLARQKIKLQKMDGLFLYTANDNLLKADQTLQEVYDREKDEDGFLYFKFAEYPSFG